jgi:hypothetical protein
MAGASPQSSEQRLIQLVRCNRIAAGAVTTRFGICAAPLYVSRAVIRGYGGDLRIEPVPSGSCLGVDAPMVTQTQ